MSITVTCELRILPGHPDEIIQRAIVRLSLPAHTVPGRRHARTLQDRDDPSHLLYLGEWESRKALDAHRDTSVVPARTDLFQHLPTFRHYRRIALFEHMFAAFDVLCVDLVQGPPETHDARRVLALNYQRTEARRQAGLVLLIANERAEESQELLLVSGWRLPSPAGKPEPSPGQSLIDQLRASGGLVNRFIGRQLIETPAFSDPS